MLTQIPDKHMAPLSYKNKLEQDLRYWNHQTTIVDICVNNS